MSRPAPDVARALPSLFARVGYDVELEGRAHRELAEGHFADAERTLLRLVGRLRIAEGPDGPGSRVEEAGPLLLDVLQGVNRRLYRADPEIYQRHRARLIERVGQPATREELIARFRAALTRLLEGVREPTDARHPVVRRAMELIRERYRDRLYLSSIAEELNVSPTYLSRIFRRDTGSTLTGYIQHIRVEAARRLITQTGRTLSEIAYAVGYQNYRDFYRNFVKVEQASPREVRRRLSR